MARYAAAANAADERREKKQQQLERTMSNPTAVPVHHTTLNNKSAQEMKRPANSFNRYYLMTALKYCSVLVILALGLSFTGYINAQQSDGVSPEPAIEGYSPVSYFTKNTAEKGSAKFSVKHQGHTYYLTSAKQIEFFNQNPDKYQPRHQLCTYSLSQGRKVSLDPTNFKIVGDHLLLFHKSKKSDGRELWNQSPIDEQILLERADKQYKLLKF